MVVVGRHSNRHYAIRCHFRILGRGIRAITLGQATARRAGNLRHRDRLDSCHIVDAIVVATAIRLGGGIVATGDPDDLRSLAREHANVKVEPLL